MPRPRTVAVATAITEEDVKNAKLPTLRTWCRQRNVPLSRNGRTNKAAMQHNLYQHLRMAAHQFDASSSSSSSAVPQPSSGATVGSAALLPALLPASSPSSSDVDMASAPQAQSTSSAAAGTVSSDVDMASAPQAQPTSSAVAGTVSSDVDMASAPQAQCTSSAVAGTGSQLLPASVDVVMQPVSAPSELSQPATSVTAAPLPCPPAETDKPQIASIPAFALLTGYKDVPANDVSPPVDRQPHPITQSRHMHLVHDRLHGKNHTRCQHRSADLVAQLRPLNTEVSEQLNRTVSP